jgi:hypothetical protein
MDFIRWYILQWEEDLFDKGVIVPLFLITLGVGVVFFALNIIVGITYAVIVGGFWCLVLYIFLSKRYRKIRDKYEREKARTSQ